ncbi:DegT/DnrJ/EryC1/StrS family aminotransferase [Nocardia sp. NBC_01377]|uniref:DegT/DnrJ/EryC1/StrS family aminotransferase n=1 Tax=Nocardia sp. NBC_01377 TaxID=2903595 RepID=UPI003250BA8E
MKVPRYNYPAQFPDLDTVQARIGRALLDGDYILGESVARFEQAFADYLGAAHVVGVNSGTDALALALIAAGVEAGDEVITVANTFHATVAAIVAVGARPILVDSEPRTYLMDLHAVEAAIGPRTCAIMAVHLFGRTLDMDRLTALTHRHGLLLIEDCAQAVGARWGTQRVGTFGALGCFSFHPSKNLAAAGDAGAVTTSDDKLAQQLRILRGLGQDGQDNHVTVGMNSKLDAIQAIILHSKLGHLDEWNQARRRVALGYHESLTNPRLAGSALAQPPGDHVHHLFQVEVPNRDTIVKRLRGDGVDAVVRYPVPIHHQTAFGQQPFARHHYPNAEQQAATTLCLPMRPDLTEPDIDYVSDRLEAAIINSERNPTT